MKTATEKQPKQTDLSKSKNIVTADELAQFKRSPMHYEHYIRNIPSRDSEDQTPREAEQQKRNLKIALHLYFQDQEEFNKTYACLKERDLPAMDKLGHKTYRLKENRNFRDVVFPEMHKGKSILPEKDYDLIHAIGKSNVDHAYINMYLNPNTTGCKDVVFFNVDEKTGLVLKSSSHFISDENILFDFVVENSANVHQFSKTIFREGINNKMVWNIDQFEKTDYVLFVIENKAPYICQPFVLDQETIEKTRNENRMLLDILFWCKKKNIYPDYSQFNILKNLYHSGGCYSMTIDDTRTHLNNLYETMPEEVSDPTHGVFNVEPPTWMK